MVGTSGRNLSQPWKLTIDSHWNWKEMVFIRTVLVKIKSLELFMKMVMGVTRYVENQNKYEICDLKGQKDNNWICAAPGQQEKGRDDESDKNSTKKRTARVAIIHLGASMLSCKENVKLFSFINQCTKNSVK